MLKENSLYFNKKNTNNTLSVTKAEFLANDDGIKDAFWMNLLGFLSLYQSHPGDNRLFLYFKQLDKARIAEITDESHDLAIAVKAMADKNFLNMTFTNEFTKFLYLLKTKQDLVIKDDLIRALLAKTPIATARGSAIVFQQVVLPFIEKKKSLSEMAAIIFPLARIKKTCADFQRIYMLMKNAAKVDIPASPSSTGSVLVKAAVLTKNVAVVAPPTPTIQKPKTNWELSVAAVNNQADRAEKSLSFSAGSIFRETLGPLAMFSFALSGKDKDVFDAVFLHHRTGSEKGAVKQHLVAGMLALVGKSSFGGFSQPYKNAVQPYVVSEMQGLNEEPFKDVPYAGTSDQDEKIINYLLDMFPQIAFPQIVEIINSLMMASGASRWDHTLEEKTMIRILKTVVKDDQTFLAWLARHCGKILLKNKMKYSTEFLEAIFSTKMYNNTSSLAIYNLFLDLIPESDAAKRAMFKAKAVAEMAGANKFRSSLKLTFEEISGPKKEMVTKYIRNGWIEECGLMPDLDAFQKKKAGFEVDEAEIVSALLIKRDLPMLIKMGYPSYKVLREKLGDEKARTMMRGALNPRAPIRAHYWAFLIQDFANGIFADPGFFESENMKYTYLTSFITINYSYLDGIVKEDFDKAIDFMQDYIAKEHDYLLKYHTAFIEQDINYLTQNREISVMLDIIYSKVGPWFYIEGQMKALSGYYVNFVPEKAMGNPNYINSWIMYLKNTPGLKFDIVSDLLNKMFKGLVTTGQPLPPLADDYICRTFIPMAITSIFTRSRGWPESFLGVLQDKTNVPKDIQKRLLLEYILEIENQATNVFGVDPALVRITVGNFLKKFTMWINTDPALKEVFKRLLNSDAGIYYVKSLDFHETLHLYSNDPESLSIDKAFLKARIIEEWKKRTHDVYYLEDFNKKLAVIPDPSIYAECIASREHQWSQITRFNKLIEQTGVDEYYMSLKNNPNLTEPERQKYFSRVIDSLKTNNKGTSRLGKVIDHILQSSLLLQNISGLQENTPIPFETKVTPQSMTEILKFNSFEINFKDAGIKPYRDEKDDYYLNIKKYENTRVAIPPPKITKVATNQEMLDQATLDLFSKCNGRHGNSAPWVLDIFEIDLMNEELKEWMAEKAATKMAPLYHGTGSIAANMILRFGFKIMQSSVGGVAVTGKMLGKGVYTSPVIDKALQYIGDSGFSRRHNLIGYILEMDAYVGTEGVDYSAAGTGTDSIRSEEYCIKNPRKQLHLKRAYRTMLVETEKVKTLMAQYVTTPKPKTESFKSFFKESRNDKFTANYIFFDGLVPFRGEMVPFDEFIQRFAGDDRIGVGFGQLGPEIWVKTDIEPIAITAHIPDTEELMRDDPDGLYTYWNAIVENL